MVNPTGGVISAGKGLFTKSFLLFVLAIILLQAVITAINEKDISKALTSLGKRFTNSVMDLKNDSDTIIAKGGINLKSFQDLLIVCRILSSLSIIIGWVYLFSKIIEFTVSDTTSIFRNYLLGTSLFIIIQIVYLLFTDRQTNPQELLILPFSAIHSLYKILPLLINPAFETIETAGNNSIISNITTYTF